MRTQRPLASLRDDDDDVPGGDAKVTAAGACFFPARGLCCPDDPLDLVLQLFPTDIAPPPPSSLAALGIGIGGGGGEPPARRVTKQERESPPTPLRPLMKESAFGGVGGGGVGGLQDSCGLSSSFLLEGLWTGLEEIDVDIFFAAAADDNDALDNGNGGEATDGSLLPDPTHMEEAAAAAAGGGPVHLHARGSSTGGAVLDVVVPDDASPMPAGAFPLQASYDACRAFDAAAAAAVFSSAPSPPAPVMAAPVPAGRPPLPFLVTTNNSGTPPPLPALIMPAAAAPAPVPPPPVFATNNSTPRLPAALIMPAAAPAPAIVSSIAPAPPPALIAPMPPRALHPNAAALAGVYSYTTAPVHATPSATPSSSPPSLTSFGPSSATSSENEILQPHHHVWVVPTKPRSPPSGNRRKRPWLLAFPLHALPPVIALPPPAANPTADADDDDGKNRNAMVLFTGRGDIAAGSGGGGTIRRRRAAPRQRNRQAKRVCSHCHSPETPQWRAGPDGPGTLCNACGIRYAGNRLLPEYRPSTAPTFRSGEHSNRHRKVMMIRDQMMKAPATEDKPPSSASEEQQQPVLMLEDDDRRTKEEDDDGSTFLGLCEYISSAAGL